MLRLHTEVVFIRHSHGGRMHAPFEGYKPGFRLQKTLTDAPHMRNDCVIASLDLDDGTWAGTACIDLKNREAMPVAIVEGELFLLQESYNVVAVGRIERIESA